MEAFLEQWDKDVDNAELEKKPLYEAMLAKLNEQPDNVDLLWRMIKVCLVVGDNMERNKNKAESKKFIEESLKYAQKAVEAHPDSMDAHKWYCASVGRMAPLVATKERIKLGNEFKTHRDIAVKIDSNDKLMHHMYGQWCYEVASLSYIERKIAETFFAKPPVATYDEALESLLIADKMDSDWKSNNLWLAKVNIALKKYKDASLLIEKALKLPVRTEECAIAQIELESLDKSYAKYRK